MKKIIFLLLVTFIIASCATRNNKQEMITMELNSDWSFRKSGDQVWLKATVPGSVHTDLMDNELIEDPYYRLNEHDQQWIDKADWEYKTSFMADEKMLEKSTIILDFEGLDTYADIYLNERHILSANNMFRSWEVQCKDFLKIGENELRIVLNSPIKIGLEKLEENGYPLPASNDQSENGEMGDKKVSIFTRKAGYHYGWDWGPRLVTSGVWRPVKLIAYNHARIEDVHIIQNDLTPNKATLTADIEINSVRSKKVNLKIEANRKLLAESEIDTKAGVANYLLDFEIEDPDLWWPNGLGKQPLYDIKVSVYNDELLDSKSTNIGLRTIKLIQKPDEEGDGESFYFEVNGHPIFAKGANYIPNDLFLPRFQPEDYERIIKDAVDANMNMLRVWGGGIYENEIFYDLCDQYGIMVWQDFMFACSMYPGDDDFLENVKGEAEENIKRLRNHPSLALWCGNNEIEVAWGEYEEGRGWGWKERYTDAQRKEIWKNYDTVFHHILPKEVAKWNPQISYWHSSPSAAMGKLASHENNAGDMHYWGVWHGQEPFSDFRKYKARFMSEYGFQSFPELNTVATYALPDEWDIESEVMVSHQRSGIGNLRIKQYMEEDYIIPADFEQFLYVSQILQAEAIKMAIESHRTEMPYCMGSLYWQLNDCWPVASWSGIDYYGRWKALHYFVKKVFQKDIIVTFQDDAQLELWVVSDDLVNKPSHLKLKVIDFSGNLLWEKLVAFDMKANSSELIDKINIKEFADLGSLNQIVLITELHIEQKEVYTDYHYFVKPKALKLEDPEIQYTISEQEDTFVIILSASKLAKNVFLSSDVSYDHFSDNFFDLLPGEYKTVSFPEVCDIEEFKENLSITYLQNK